MTTKARPAEHAPIHRHIKRATTAWAFFAFLACLPAFAEIDVRPQYDVNEAITVKVVATGIPEGALLRGSFQIPTATWELVAVPNGKELRAVATNLRSQAEKIDAAVQPDAKKAMIDAAQEIERTVGSEAYHVWAKVGTHTITASGIWVLTDTGTLGGKLLDFGVYQYTKTFVVGEGDELVPPPPPPVVGGPYQIWMLYDADTKDNLPQPQQAVLTSLTFQRQLERAGHRVLGVSAAQAITAAETSKYAAYFAAAKNVPLPCLVVSAIAGGKCVAMPLPADEAATAKLLATELLK
jgi:hypothetical protein